MQAESVDLEKENGGKTPSRSGVNDQRRMNRLGVLNGRINGEAVYADVK